MPFDVDKANPEDDAIVSQFPSNERDSRTAIEEWMDFEHDKSSGRHKIPYGTTTARDAITTWKQGSLWIDSATNQLQVQVSATATFSWKACALDADLQDHIDDTSNPHSVTAAQVGALATTGGSVTGTVTMTGNLIMNGIAIVGLDSGSTQRALAIYNKTSDQTEFGDANKPIKLKGTGDAKYNADTIWTSGNDGSGSGLDADKVRGVDAIFTNSLGANGYQKLPGGLIIQWGHHTASAAGTVTFPTAFIASCYSVQLTVDSNAGGDTNNSVDNVTTSGFHFNQTNDFYWFAVGK